jgi:hypothetical protein
LRTPDAGITEHTVIAGEHITHYLAAGPVGGPLVIFVHGWPELSLSCRQQLPVMGEMGFRAGAVLRTISSYCLIWLFSGITGKMPVLAQYLDRTAWDFSETR